MLPPLSLFSRCVCAVCRLSLSLLCLSLSFLSVCFILFWFDCSQISGLPALSDWASECARLLGLQNFHCNLHFAFGICDLRFVNLHLNVARVRAMNHSFTRCCCCWWWFKYRFALICISIALFRHFTMDYFAVASTECELNANRMPLNAMWFIYGCISSAFAVVVVWQIMRPLFVIVCI